MPYRPDIDGLRAIAVLAVLLFHAGLGCPGGYVGVDVFFVISGYLITRQIAKDLEAGTFSFVGFWERRVRRIWPASLVMVGVVLSAGWLLMLPEELEALAKSAAAHLLCLANVNFRLNAEAGYFQEAGDFFPLLHTWSLGVEEQFYILFPPILYFLSKRRPGVTMTALAGLGLASLVLSIWSADAVPAAAFYLLPSRCWELLIGGALAVGPSSRWAVPRGVAELGSLAGLFGMILPMAFYDESTPFPGWTALPPCLGCAAVIWTNTGNTTFVGRALAWRPLVMIGLMSYSLYLWHWPILSFYRILYGAPLSPGTASALLVAAGAIGWCSWRFIEMPFRLRRVGSTRRALFLPAVAGNVVLLVVALVFYKNDGFRNRVAASLLKDVAHHGIRYVPRGDMPVDSLPVLGAPDAERIDFLIWGDSHAMAITQALDEAARSRRLSGLAAVRPAAIPIPELGSADESSHLEWNDAVLRFVLKHEVRHVLLAARWRLYTEGWTDIDRQERRDAQSTVPLVAAAGTKSSGITESRRQFVEKLDALVKRLREGNVQVWILRQVPEQSQTRLASSWARAHALGFDRIGVFSPQPFSATEHDQKQAAVNGMLEEIARRYDGVILIDPAPALFAGDGALPLHDGHCLYRDDDHLSYTGSKLLVERACVPLLDKMATQCAVARTIGERRVAIRR